MAGSGAARWIVRTAGMVLACAVAAACGSPSPKPGMTRNVEPSNASSPSPSPSGAGSSTAANRRLAQREAQRLVGLAQVPPGAVPLSALPRSLSGPLLGVPAADSLARAGRAWGAPAGFAETLAWLHAHPPAGLTASGSGSGSTPEFSFAGDSYTAPGSDAWSQAGLQVAVVRLGPHSTGIRVDAIVVWLDPRPLRDDVAGPRLQLAAGRCPPRDAGMVGVAASHRAADRDLDRGLLPAGDPLGGQVCWYAGMNGQDQLVRQRSLSQPAAGRIAAAVRQLRLAHPVGEVSSCGNDDGSVVVLAFSYPGRPDVPLWLTGGCPSISNGHIRAAADDLRTVVDAATR